MSRERRRDNRVDVDWTVRIGRRGASVTSVKAKNASISGIYVETALVLQIGDRILLEIHVDTTQGSRPILCEALIVRRNAAPQSNIYGYGMQFTRIDDEALQRILIVITELWAGQSSTDAASYARGFYPHAPCTTQRRRHSNADNHAIGRPRGNSRAKRRLPPSTQQPLATK